MHFKSGPSYHGILRSNSFIFGRNTFSRYSTTSARSWPSIYTPFRRTVRVHPNFTSHRRAVRSQSGLLGVIPTDGKMILFSACLNLFRVIDPIGCSVSHVLHTVRTTSSIESECAFLQPPRRSFGNCSNI